MGGAADVQISVLGPIRVIDRDSAETTLPPQLRRIVGILVCAEGGPVTADRIAEYAVAGRVDGSGVKSAMSRLRKVLGDRIEHVAGGYRLRVKPSDIDAQAFLAAYAAAGALPADDRVAALGAALAGWRGEPFGELAEEEWALPTVARLRAMRSGATEELAQAYLDVGREDAAIALLRSHIVAHPFRERPVALLMTALAEVGDSVEALRVYRRFRTELRDEAGLDPSSQLRELEQALLGDEGSTSPHPSPTPDRDAPGHERTPSPPRSVGNLPRQLTGFVGRSSEVGGLVTLVRDHPLVTVIGVGGVGKTRVAIEAASRTASDHPDGVWFADLAAVGVDEAVPAAVAAGVGVTPPPDGSVVEHLVARLRGCRLLLVIDNCEHLLDAVGEIAAALTAECPNVGVIATSREPLGVDAEWICPLRPLERHDAVRLFVERAHAAGWAPLGGVEQRAAIADLCDRLDCLPLAVELAASRARSFGPTELLSMIVDRFDVLVGGARTRTERHHTMRNAIDWSYRLCRPVEQIVFDRLSVFPGGFDLDAARAVVADGPVSEFDVVDALAHLVDRSLVGRGTAGDGSARYHLLETLRAYGRDHLSDTGELDQVRGRHARFIAGAVVGLQTDLFGPDERRWLHRLREYVPDMLAALEWLITDRRWDLASDVVPCRWIGLEREVSAMARRLHRAMRQAGETGLLVDLARLADDEWITGASQTELRARTWEVLRSPAFVASGRVLQVDPTLFPEDEEEAGELLAISERFESMAASGRLLMNWTILRSILCSGYSIPVESWRRFTSLVEGLHSVTACRLIDELRAQRARSCGRSGDAAALFERAAQHHVDEPVLDPWFVVVTMWNAIHCAALVADPPDSLAKALENWRAMQSDGVAVLRWRGAAVTALALAAVGQDDLAERFAEWARRTDPGGVFDQFRADLSRLGLDEPPESSSTDDLDELIDRLQDVVDARTV